jgi:hypothetical protein
MGSPAPWAGILTAITGPNGITGLQPGIQPTALYFGSEFGLNWNPNASTNGIAGRIEVALVGSASLAPTFGPVTASSLAVGPYYMTAARATTNGASPALLVAAPMATDSDATVDFEIDGSDGTYQLRAATPSAGGDEVPGWNTYGGVGTYEGPDPVTECTFPLWPTFAWAWNDITQEWTLGVTGPNATVTGAAAGAGGKLQLALAGTVTSAIAGVGLTVAGLTGTPLGNGAHPGSNVVYVDAHTVLLTDVTYVAPDTAGQVTETAGRTIKWSTKIEIVVSP